MSDQLAHRFPVSVKGVIRCREQFILLKNERNEWELPGGKLEIDEKLEDCLVREIKEELGLDTSVSRPLNNWVYFVNRTNVVILTYALEKLVPQQHPRISDEHKELGLFELSEIDDLPMPDGYKRSIYLFGTRSEGAASDANQ